MFFENSLQEIKCLNMHVKRFFYTWCGFLNDNDVWSIPKTLIQRLHGRIICHMNGNFVGFQNIKSTKWFKRDRMDFVYADLKSNFKFWGCLRPVWPLKSHISSFLFKYHIALAFFHLRLIRGHFAIDLILLQKPGFLHVDLWPQ